MIHIDDEPTEKFDAFVLDRCSKYLSRANKDAVHLVNSGLPGANNHYTKFSEAWRFPFIDAVREHTDDPASQIVNRVTFVFPGTSSTKIVEVAGTFGSLHSPTMMKRVADTDYFAASFLIPTRGVYRYKYRVDGQWLLDPVNVQCVELDNGSLWSRFFTERCTTPLILEAWERDILKRLAAHILPFRTKSGDDFIKRNPDISEGYRFDKTVGSVNYIDKILAREESHHLIDYRICLILIDDFLRQRNPFIEPKNMSKNIFTQLYEDMGKSSPGGFMISGWDTSRYENPSYFLKLLRRHVFTGAFCHPRHGGNAGAIGWLWLEDKYTSNGKTLFDWRRSLESPYGNNLAYAG